MAVELLAPVCAETGLPLPIAPVEPPQGARLNSGRWDYHHKWQQSSHPHFQTVPGRVLRLTYGQWVYRPVHEKFNSRYADLEKYPETERENYRLTVLGIAGVIPRYGINPYALPGEGIIELNSKQLEYLSDPRISYIECAWSNDKKSRIVRSIIGRYLADYALSQDLPAMFPEITIERFLDPKTDGRTKKWMANMMINQALGYSVEGFAPQYEQYVAESPVHPSRSTRLHVAINKIFTKNYFEDYHETVTDRLLIATGT